jgi:hypothetical protein
MSDTKWSQSMQPTNVSWYRPLTAADLSIIETLPEDVRAAVERYARMNVRVLDRDQQSETEYERGWQDAMDRMEDEISGIHFPSPPRRLSKKAVA